MCYIKWTYSLYTVTEPLGERLVLVGVVSEDLSKVV